MRCMCHMTLPYLFASFFQANVVDGIFTTVPLNTAVSTGVTSVPFTCSNNASQNALKWTFQAIGSSSWADIGNCSTGGPFSTPPYAVKSPDGFGCDVTINVTTAAAGAYSCSYVGADNETSSAILVILDISSSGLSCESNNTSPVQNQSVAMTLTAGCYGCSYFFPAITWSPNNGKASSDVLNNLTYISETYTVTATQASLQAYEVFLNFTALGFSPGPGQATNVPSSKYGLCNFQQIAFETPATIAVTTTVATTAAAVATTTAATTITYAGTTAATTTSVPTTADATIPAATSTVTTAPAVTTVTPAATTATTTTTTFTTSAVTSVAATTTAIGTTAAATTAGAETTVAVASTTKAETAEAAATTTGVGTTAAGVTTTGAGTTAAAAITTGAGITAAPTAAAATTTGTGTTAAAATTTATSTMTSTTTTLPSATTITYAGTTAATTTSALTTADATTATATSASTTIAPTTIKSTAAVSTTVTVKSDSSGHITSTDPPESHGQVTSTFTYLHVPDGGIRSGAHLKHILLVAAFVTLNIVIH